MAGRYVNIFVLNDTATTEIYTYEHTLSLHDALPICRTAQFSRTGTLMRVCFPYIAQSHQILHSLPIAMEMAIAFPDIEVHVACATDENAEIVRNIAALYPEAKVVDRKSTRLNSSH